QRQPAFPEAVHEDVAAESDVPRIDEELVVAENPRERGVIAEIDMLHGLADRMLGLGAAHGGQIFHAHTVSPLVSHACHLAAMAMAAPLSAGPTMPWIMNRNFCSSAPVAFDT